MPTGICETLAVLSAGAAAGVGTGISGALQGSATKSAAKISNEGPVRGGSARAGNADKWALSPEATALERIGKNALATRSPVYGNPIDFDQLTRPQQFGTGYNLSRQTA